MDVLLDALIIVAGIALVGHVAICAALQHRLSDRAEVLDELFAVPNRRLSTGINLRLLRARHYFPRAKSGLEDFRLGRTTHTLLFGARLTGLVVPIAALAFFAVSFAQGVR